MVNKKNVLICPLDWGLGHASRCVPVIQAFIDANVNVIIAADNRPLAFLRKEFPNLQWITFSAYQISYQRKGSLLLKLLGILPQFLKSIYKEHKLLDKIINEYKIDIVVSDNRFGLWNKKAKCIFMTHQVLIKSLIKSAIFDKILFYIDFISFKKFFSKNINNLYSDCLFVFIIIHPLIFSFHYLFFSRIIYDFSIEKVSIIIHIYCYTINNLPKILNCYFLRFSVIFYF